MSMEEKGYRKETQEILDAVNCPHQVFTAGGEPQEVLSAYRQAVRRGKKEGFVPVLVVSSDLMAETLSYLPEESYSKEEVIQEGGESGEELLKEWLEERFEDWGDEFGEDGMFPEEMLGEKADGECIDTLSSLTSFNGSGTNEIILFEVPVEHPWEVIAWIPMGGWNECPAAREMMAVCRYWYEKHGAVPALISSDVLEMIVEEPVSDEEEAWQLAREHFAFCPDRVDQGTQSGTIGEVADCLSQSTVWFFWWD